eukprot:COSAG01_NODE_4478_length_4986_cov_3.398813_9_plen_67_part_00
MGFDALILCRTRWTTLLQIGRRFEDSSRKFPTAVVPRYELVGNPELMWKMLSIYVSEVSSAVFGVR